MQILMKRYLLLSVSLLLLSGCLGGGGGDGGGSSSSGGGSKKKPQSCNIANGSGQKEWDKATKKYSTTCKVVTCDAGYDNDQDSTQCQETAANFYSPAKDKTRKKCPAPSDSSPTRSTMLSSANGCYKCNSGYLKNTGENTCDVPAQGKYVDSSGSEQSCTNPGGTPGWFNEFVDNTGGVATETGCNFSCKSGFVKNTTTFTCSIPDRGNYADNGVEKSCSSITGDSGGFKTFSANTGAVSSATGCGFSCKAGFVKSGRACNFPRKGKYVNTAGSEQGCTNPGGTPGGFKEFLDNTKAVDSAKGCDFSCKPNHVKSVSSYTCTQGEPCLIANGEGFKRIPTDLCQVVDCNAGFDSIADTAQCQPTASGFFSLADDKTRKICPTPTNSSPTTTTGLSSADDCYNCNNGYLKNTGENTCDVPSKGNYVNASGNEVSCNPITLQRAATSTWIAGAADDADACLFSCSDGYVKIGRACNTPGLGKYADNGVEKACSPITGDLGGFDDFAANTGAVTAADGCDFSCNAGFVKDASALECNFPSSGNYVDAGNTEQSCTDITGVTGFGSWVSGAATADDACPFSCSTGYTISGRTCRKPKILALGANTSHVLFSTGEVEAWGQVSIYPWRSHIKENLGGNTPQALVSGSYHQCIILENASLDHGRLMCWGKNGDDRLGVGDTNPRTTPTTVTATVLGDAGGGTPNTVKSVAAGYNHTCAILNDNTVVCWGNNSNGQIGGGSTGGTKTISGTTAGNPLDGGTASRIAAAEFHTCAVLSDKSVKCWGDNSLGQTGGGTPNLGVGKTATEIATGDYFSCAILNDGSIKCWGFTNLPPVLGMGKTATKIAARGDHACALLSDETVSCWGNGDECQIGGRSTSSYRAVSRGTMRDPLDGQTAIHIATGSYHTCAIMKSDNSVKCWGMNLDGSDTGFYGQIVGDVPMKGGSNGTGTSTGVTGTLTVNSTPSPSALETDVGGKVCGLAVTDSTHSITLKYATPKTYNSLGNRTLTAAIDNLIAAVGTTVRLGGSNITLAKHANGDKIVATVDLPIFDGKILNIMHDDDSGDCSGPLTTPIALSGSTTAGVAAKGLWVISDDYVYSNGADQHINLDTEEIDLSTASLTKEEIADAIVTIVNGGSWTGMQYKDLPYTATKLEGSSDAGDDCPDTDYCVVFSRVFKGTEGNYGIPFGDRDYEH